MMDTYQKFERDSGWAIGLGIGMIVLGLVAFAAPIFTSIAVNYILAALFVVSGLIQGVYAFRQNWGSSLVLKLMLGLLYLVLGIVLLVNPLAGAISLTLFVGMFFVIDGVFRVILAFQLKPQPRWGWVLINAVLMIILGILIWSQWPNGALWMLGLLVGFGLLLNGLSTLLFGTSRRRLER